MLLLIGLLIILVSVALDFTFAVLYPYKTFEDFRKGYKYLIMCDLGILFGAVVSLVGILI